MVSLGKNSETEWETMKKKTAKQKANTNAKRGKAQNKHKTLAKELLLIKNETVLVNDDYPLILKTESQKRYYDVLLESCQSMSVLFHNSDKFRVAVVARLMSICDDLLIETADDWICKQQNGNTLIIQEKINPRIILWISLDRRIDSKLKDLGLTPQIRAEILQKVSTLLSNDVIDNKTSQSNDLGPNLDDFLAKHKIKPK